MVSPKRKIKIVHVDHVAKGSIFFCTTSLKPTYCKQPFGNEMHHKICFINQCLQPVELVLREQEEKEKKGKE